MKTQYCIKIDLVPDPISVIERERNENRVITRFISFCMLATGVNRLFSKEAVKEFLYRLAIILNSYGIAQSFFMNDSIITFEHRGRKFEITLENITDLLGVEINNSPCDMLKRTAWIKKMEKLWVEGLIAMTVSEGPIIDKKLIGENRYKLGTNKPKFNDEISKVAELFSTEAMKTIGEEPIAALEKRVWKMRELTECAQAHYKEAKRTVKGQC